MCFHWPFSLKKIVARNYRKIHPCSCELCYRNFNTLEDLIIHMGGHNTDDINTKLLRGYGLVKCKNCFLSFDTTADMYDHACCTTISGLSPVGSYDSLSSVIIRE